MDEHEWRCRNGGSLGEFSRRRPEDTQWRQPHGRCTKHDGSRCRVPHLSLVPELFSVSPRTKAASRRAVLIAAHVPYLAGSLGGLRHGCIVTVEPGTDAGALALADGFANRSQAGTRALQRVSPRRGGDWRAHG